MKRSLQVRWDSLTAMRPWLNAALALLALHGLACEHDDDREAANPPARPAVEGGAPTAPAKMRDAAPQGERERYDGGLVAPAVDLSARREIVRRECQARRYGDGFTDEPAAVVPGVTCSGATCGPSIECTRPQDCGGSAFVRCLGWAEGVCRYDADAGAVVDAGAYDGGVTAGCVADDDCRAQAGGRCEGVILQTRCQSVSTCGADTDCAPNQACLCTANGDKTCMEADCRADTDCPAAQSCLRTHPCNWGPFGDLRCTTAQDECKPGDPSSCECDFDRKQRRWMCRERVICD